MRNGKLGLGSTRGCEILLLICDGLIYEIISSRSKVEHNIEVYKTLSPRYNLRKVYTALTPN